VRLSTLGPGTSFGEMVLLGQPRSQRLGGRGDYRRRLLGALGAPLRCTGGDRTAHPMRVLDNIARDLSVRLRDLNVLIASLAA